MGWNYCKGPLSHRLLIQIFQIMKQEIKKSMAVNLLAIDCECIGQDLTW